MKVILALLVLLAPSSDLIIKGLTFQPIGFGHSRVPRKHSSASASMSMARAQDEIVSRTSNSITGDYDFPYWSRAFNSQPDTFDYVIPINGIDGELPSDLSGTLFRAMPALFERGGVAYGHYLDGDGYTVRITFSPTEGVHFKSAFVQTEEYKKENQANKILYRSTFRTQRPQNSKWTGGLFCLQNGLDLKLKNLANTNNVFWGGRLLALFEAGLPHRLDPVSLDTLGEYDMELGRGLKSGLAVIVPALKSQFPDIHDSIFGAFMTAHPKIDPTLNHLVAWTSQAEVGDNPLKTRPQITIHEWDSAFNRPRPPVVHTLTSTTVAPHDFSITPEYYVFIENRIEGNTLPYVLGTKSPAECVDIVPGLDMIINLVPRHQPQPATTTATTTTSSDSNSIGSEVPLLSPIRLPLTPGFTIHSVCAWQQQKQGEQFDKILADEKRKENSDNGNADSPSPKSELQTRPPNPQHTLHLLTTAWKSETVASGQVKGGLLGSWEGRAPNFDSIPVTLLYETIVDLSSPSEPVVLRHAPVKGMEQTIIEHPHINPNYEGSQPRYVYMSVGSQTGISSPPLGYMRLDLETGEKQEWYAPLHTYCEELVIVPKNIDSANNKDDKAAAAAAVGSGESSVWLLASMFDAVRNKSLIGIIDGEAVHKGPVATIWLTHHLPHSLHGCFTSETFYKF